MLAIVPYFGVPFKKKSVKLRVEETVILTNVTVLKWEHILKC